MWVSFVPFLKSLIFNVGRDKGEEGEEEREINQETSNKSKFATWLAVIRSNVPFILYIIYTDLPRT